MSNQVTTDDEARARLDEIRNRLEPVKFLRILLDDQHGTASYSLSLEQVTFINNAVRDIPFLLDLVAQHEAANRQSICVYCGELLEYASVQAKLGDDGNQMRIEHLKQCSARPELKLIAEIERLQSTLVQSRQQVIKLVEDKRDEWVRLGNSDETRPLDVTIYAAKTIAANEILSVLKS